MQDDRLTRKLVEALQKDGGYKEVKLLDDGCIVAIGDLLYTRAIYMDLDAVGYGKRYCFKDRALADAEFKKLQTGEEEPTGWIARR